MASPSRRSRSGLTFSARRSSGSQTFKKHIDASFKLPPPSLSLLRHSLFHAPSHDPQKRYLLNLIDTPGHVDFTTEVLRSLAAAEAAILLVDASQGVQAQTLAVLAAARRQGLLILPVLNKIDLPAAEPDRVAAELAKLTHSNPAEVLRISAKTGEGVEKVLDRLIQRVPPPAGDRSRPVRAFVFDSWFDHFQGVVSLVKLADGSLKKGKIDFIGFISLFFFFYNSHLVVWTTPNPLNDI